LKFDFDLQIKSINLVSNLVFFFLAAFLFYLVGGSLIVPCVETGIVNVVIEGTLGVAANDIGVNDDGLDVEDVLGSSGRSTDGIMV